MTTPTWPIAAPQSRPRNRNATGVDHPTRYWIESNHPLTDLAEGFADQYLSEIVGAITRHPRSLQRRIGPSEIGIDCDRALLHKLNQDTEPPRSPGWKPTVGTAVHAFLDDVFTATSATNRDQQDRFATEHRVTVGTIGTTPITGSVDLFDRWLGVVADHKIVGPSMLSFYRKNGPSTQYRIQAHLYGAGWAATGANVKLVSICFLPREGELKDAYIWTEPWRPDIVDAAMTRANNLETARTVLGVDTALTAYPYCKGRFCIWCRTEERTMSAQGHKIGPTAQLFS